MYQLDDDIESLFSSRQVGKILIIQVTSKHKDFNPFQPSVMLHIETIHLISPENQLTGFFMKRNTGLKWVKLFSLFVNVS